MKRHFHIIRPILLIGVGLFLALVSAAVSHPIAANNGLGMAATATPAPPPASEVGSTDGLVLMSVLIVLIVVVPILIRRKSWNN